MDRPAGVLRGDVRHDLGRGADDAAERGEDVVPVVHNEVHGATVGREVVLIVGRRAHGGLAELARPERGALAVAAAADALVPAANDLALLARVVGRAHARAVAVGIRAAVQAARRRRLRWGI